MIDNLITTTSGKTPLQSPFAFPIPNQTDVIFTLTYLDKEEFRTLSEGSTKIDFDPKTRQPIRIRDDEKLTKALIKKYVNGWTGLTFRKLFSLVQVDKAALKETFKKAADQGNPMTLDSELGFDQDLCFTLIQRSYGLELWLLDNLMNIANFQTDLSVLEDELKNLSGSPVGS